MTRPFALLVLFCLGSCISLDSFLFNPTVAQPNDNLLQTARDVPESLRSELKTITADDGTVVNTWALQHSPNDGTPVSRHNTAILYCHGNAQNIAFFAQRIQALWKQGYTVLIFDYRGYGKTPGVPNESGVYADARAARAAISSLTPTFDPNHVAYYGYSLGGAICAQLAVEQPTPVLILESAFASVAELAQDNQDLNVPRAWYADTLMDTRGKIGRHHGALLVLHGSDDTYVQSKYGAEISAAADGHASVNQLWIVPKANHDTVPCAVRDRISDTPGDCIGGFSSEYLARVSSVVDAAIPPP